MPHYVLKTPFLKDPASPCSFLIQIDAVQDKVEHKYRTIATPARERHRRFSLHPNGELPSTHGCKQGVGRPDPNMRGQCT